MLAGAPPSSIPTPGITTVTNPPAGAYTPSQIRHAYGFDQITFGTLSGDGSGQTIAIVDAYDDPNIAQDLTTFDANPKIGLAAPPSFTKLNQNGVNGSYPTKDRSGGWALETALDVEWAHAVAPKANILLVEANSASDSDLLAAVDTAAARASVVSMSWGGGEFSGETSSAYENHFIHSGVTFVASSGDSGAPASWPAISPNVVAVGGTTLKLDTSKNWSSETGWSGSGGGISSPGNEAQPAYQKGVVTQSTTQRTNPDVAYDGDPNTGFAVYDSVAYYPYYPWTSGAQNGWFQIGGTSAGAPQWAALVAIANQGRGKTPLNSTDPQETLKTLYNSSVATDYHDISSGTSTGTPNYSAKSGYDLVTGLGSPTAAKVVQALVTPPTPAPPAAPTGLKANADPAGPITLSWNASPGATEYDIYNGSQSLLFTTSGSTTSVQNTGVSAGTSYTYQVVAKNSVGPSGFSNSATATALAPSTLFQDSFDPPSSTFPPPGSSWVVAGSGSSWSENPSNGTGVLSQTSTADGDPKKAVNTSVAPSSTMEIFAKVRIDSWVDGEYARAGVGLLTDPTSAQGYGLLVRDQSGGTPNTPNTIQFLNDGVAWGNQYTLPTPLTVSTSGNSVWYDFRLLLENGVLSGSVWPDGTTEPSTWQLTQTLTGTNWTRTSGYPALNGGSSGYWQPSASHSSSTASFDSVVVTGG